MDSDDGPVWQVDWECGVAEFEPGERLDSAPAEFRRDVLSDWKTAIDALLGEAVAELEPDRALRHARDQRVHNHKRRRLCEQLSGQTIVLAEPLVNGDVLLHLQSGRAVVLYAHREDVKLDTIADAAAARRYAVGHGTGDWYVREDAHEERAR